MKVANIVFACLFPFGLLAQEQTTALVDGHIDVAVLYTPGKDHRFQIEIHDDENSKEFLSSQAAIILGDQSRFDLPAGTPFGTEGESIWILPQTQAEGIVFLGFSTETISPTVIPGGMKLMVNNVDLPGREETSGGRFFAWQAGQFGSFDVAVNTSDGIDSADFIPLLVPSHAHYNLGFSSPGIWNVTLQARGIIAGEPTDSLSAETTVTFHVHPLKPFEIWQSTNWAPSTLRSTMGATSDPDNDKLPNLLEFALGLDPNKPDAGSMLTLATNSSGGNPQVEITYSRSKLASDVKLEVVVARDLTSKSWEPVTTVVRTTDNGITERVTVRDSSPIDQTDNRFYRLRATQP